MVFFLTWIAYFLGFGVVATYWIYIVVYIVVQIIRLWIMKGLLDFPVSMFMKEVVWKVTLPSIVSIILPFVCVSVLPSSIYRTLLTCCVCVISSIISIYLLGLTRGEQMMINEKVNNLFKKVFK